MLKPEMRWQIAQGMAQTREQVICCVLALFLWLRLPSRQVLNLTCHIHTCTPLLQYACGMIRADSASKGLWFGGHEAIYPELDDKTGEGTADAFTVLWHGVSLLLQVIVAEKALYALQARVHEFFKQFDILCCPCVMTQPFDVKTRQVSA